MSERPRLRSDLVLVEQTYRGEQSYIVKDPSTRKYFRFRPVEVLVMQALDGRSTAAEASAALVGQGLTVSAAAIGKFAEKLKTMGLVERSLGERSVLLMERLRAQRRQRLRQGPFQGDLFRLRWSMGDPDHFMDRTIPYLRFCFTRGFVLASLALFAAYFVVLAVKWPEFTGALSDLYHFRMSGADLLVLWLTGLCVIAAHELAHGYTCKHFGGQVHEIGAMLLYFEPAFFCNVNDAWTFPDLRARLWVTAAGSWIQMVLASLAALVWWAATPDTLIYQVALAVVLIGGITTVIVNLNPLIPLDGYYALIDWLEVANLRQRAFRHLSWLVRRYGLRRDVPMPPADEREQRIFLIYGLLSLVYTGSILLFVAGVVQGWLSAALGAFGVVLFAGLVLVMARPALREWGREGLAAWRDWRAERSAGAQGNRWPRYALIALGAVVIVGALLPRPITVTGQFAVVPAGYTALVSPDTGIVVTVAAREGLRVAPGAVLARIRSFDLEHDQVAAARAADSLAARELQARARGDEGLVAREASLRSGEQARARGLGRRVESMTLRAPSPGVVLTARPEELVGTWVSIGDTVLELGNPAALEARIGLAGAGAALVRPGQPVRLMVEAGSGALVTDTLDGVSEAATAGGVEGWVRLVPGPLLRVGMAGQASVTLRESNLWGALWWAVRRRVRTDLLL